MAKKIEEMPDFSCEIKWEANCSIISFIKVLLSIDSYTFFFEFYI